MTSTFQPEDFNFAKLDLQNGSLCFYEYKSGSFCNGKVDPHRLNVYLTQDREFVTVWDGFFDPSFIGQEFLDLIARSGFSDFDFGEQYNTPLFRGFIETKEQAEIVLNALRIDKFRPSVLKIDEENHINCESLLPQEALEKFEPINLDIKQSISEAAVKAWLRGPVDAPFPKPDTFE